jgi:chitinase
MGNALLYFIFSNSSNRSINPYPGSNRICGDSTHCRSTATIEDRSKKAMGADRYRAMIPLLLVVLLVSFILMSIPINALASRVTLAWDVKNQTQDGFQVFKRTANQAYDYTNPAWPTDGNNRTQTSCTISDLTEGVKYYFVVRAYAGSNQSADSNEVTYMAPAPGPVTVVNNNHPPEAEAGVNKYVNAGDHVILDGSGTSDPDGDILSYTWIQKSGPTVELFNANSVQGSFTAPDSITDTSVMVFELNVTDILGAASSDTCVVLINAEQQESHNDSSPIDEAADNNSPPEQPTLAGLADGESGVSLTPLLKASGFDDANPDDRHLRTEWRIAFSSGSQQIVLDRTGGKSQLTEFRVPQLVLEPSTAYSVQVRFFDNHGLPSQWSPPVDFTTGMDENDQNQNRVPDSQEITTATDMNGDTIIDAEQDLVVKSLMTYNQRHMISVSVELNDSDVQLQAAASIDPATLTAADDIASYSGSETPYGMLGYKIKVGQPGDVIAVKFNLPEPIDPQKTQWVRYDAIEGMIDCDASTDIDDSGLTVNRYIVDGGDEDADGVANGIIVELTGPRTVDTIDDTDDFNQAVSNADQTAAGGSSSGCFIRSLF